MPDVMEGGRTYTCTDDTVRDIEHCHKLASTSSQLLEWYSCSASAESRAKRLPSRKGNRDSQRGSHAICLRIAFDEEFGMAERIDIPIAATKLWSQQESSDGGVPDAVAIARRRLTVRIIRHRRKPRRRTMKGRSSYQYESRLHTVQDELLTLLLLDIISNGRERVDIGSHVGGNLRQGVVDSVVQVLVDAVEVD